MTSTYRRLLARKKQIEEKPPKYINRGFAQGTSATKELTERQRHTLAGGKRKDERAKQTS